MFHKMEKKHPWPKLIKFKNLGVTRRHEKAEASLLQLGNHLVRVLPVRIHGRNDLQTVAEVDLASIARPVAQDLLDQANGLRCVGLVKEQNGRGGLLLGGHLLKLK